MKFLADKGKVLLQPRKEIKVTKTFPVPDDEKNKTLGPDDVREVKTIKRKVKANHQIGVVVSSNKDSQYAYGDIVVFIPNRFVMFDLIKNTILGDEYGIVGRWDENEE